MDWLKKVAKALGGVVDAAVPVQVGDRTKLAVVGCLVLGVAGHVVPPPWSEVLAAVRSALCASVPAFAVAGVARKIV